MIKDNRRLIPFLLFFLAVILTVFSIILLILPDSFFSIFPVSDDFMGGIILILLSMGIFVLPVFGIVLAILAIFRFKTPLLAFVEILLNLAVPVTVLSFDIFKF